MKKSPDRKQLLPSGPFSICTKSGQLFWKTGAVFASSDCIEIHIHGKGGHVLPRFWPLNPILIAAEIINSLQGLVSRESTYNVPAVLTVTGITAGNGAYNIIPNSATIVGGLRTQSLEAQPPVKTYGRNHNSVLPCTAQLLK
ncbi:MAG: peptidase dimerization domain-containing protein [Enterocloster sp.]